MSGKVWTVAFATAHKVEAVNSSAAGPPTILVDGASIDLRHEPNRDGAKVDLYSFSIDGLPMELHREKLGSRRSYDRLKADGEWLDPPAPVQQFPTWSLIFIGLAVLPAVQAVSIDRSLFSFVFCGAIALGATLGILLNARDPLQSLERKLFRCGILAALVWGVLVLPGVMLVGAVKLLNG